MHDIIKQQLLAAVYNLSVKEKAVMRDTRTIRNAIPRGVVDVNIRGEFVEDGHERITMTCGDGMVTIDYPIRRPLDGYITHVQLADIHPANMWVSALTTATLDRIEQYREEVRLSKLQETKELETSDIVLARKSNGRLMFKNKVVTVGARDQSCVLTGAHSSTLSVKFDLNGGKVIITDATPLVTNMVAETTRGSDVYTEIHSVLIPVGHPVRQFLIFTDHPSEHE